MESFEERLDRLEYYQNLLLQMIDSKDYPFYRLIMEAKLSKQEVEEFLQLCEDMSILYKKQKAEGFVVFAPLLTQFAEKMHPNLDVNKTIHALLNQKMYIPLMSEFTKIIKNSQ